MLLAVHANVAVKDVNVVVDKLVAGLAKVTVEPKTVLPLHPLSLQPATNPK